MAAIAESAESISDKKKAEANLHFVNGNFEEAEKLYSEALECSDSQRAVLLANRAAARISMKRFSEALEDANASLQLDPAWLKAYYRKASALDGLQRDDLSYYTWVEATKLCEGSPALTKQYQQAEKKWLNKFRSGEFPIQSRQDLVARYKLLRDSRERLSTLAHMWNDSTPEERLSFFRLLLSLIAGAGEAHDDLLHSNELQAESMMDMPLDNYPDFPREHLGAWMDYFRALSSDEKCAVIRELWFSLNSAEQNAVILDMRLFAAKASGREDIVLAMQEAALDDSESGIDFSFKKNRNP